MARISLCMIVKDEENRIADCLQSARAAVDELIVVDTGSTDKTKEIALDHGARVHTFEWCGDFSAARNESLRYAGGDWILVLDADERLTPQACKQVRQLVAAGAYDCYLLQIRSPYQTQSEFRRISTVMAARLFRTRPHFRFVGRLHESLDIRSFAEDESIAVTNITIDHLGYSGNIVDKFRRNYSITQPDDPSRKISRFDLIRRDMALHCYEQALDRIARELQDPSVEPWLKAQLNVFLGDIRSAHRNDRAGAISAWESAAMLDPSLVAPWLRLGSLHHHLGKIEMALSDFIRVIDLLETGSLRGARLDDEVPLSEAHILAASCWMKLGRQEEAMDHLSRSRPSIQEDVQAAVKPYRF